MGGAEIFYVKNRSLLCLVDHYNKFTIVRKADSLAADDLFRAVKTILG